MLFRSEQVSTDMDDLLSDTEISKQATEGKEQRTLGLGLATVARFVRNMDGQLRLKSEQGRGSRFVMQLPFVIHVDETRPNDENERPGSSVAVTPPPTGIGELTLIENSSSLRTEGVLQKRILEEGNSLRRSESGSSNKSSRSSKSVVDRLIDAISSSLSDDNLKTEELPIQRSNSRESGHGRGMARPRQMFIPNEKSDSSARPGSLSAREHARTPSYGHQEAEFVTDDKTKKEVRIPDKSSESPRDNVAPHIGPKVVFDFPNDEATTSSTPQESSQLNAEHLQILVAEDNPINSRIIKKRLEKSGHLVYLTINGEECTNAYREKPAFFDVVLMDMQVSVL